MYHFFAKGNIRREKRLMNTGKFAEGKRICPSHAMGLSLFWKFEQSSSPRPKNMPPACFCPSTTWARESLPKANYRITHQNPPQEKEAFAIGDASSAAKKRLQCKRLTLVWKSVHTSGPRPKNMPPACFCPSTTWARASESTYISPVKNKSTAFAVLRFWWGMVDSDHRSR